MHIPGLGMEYSGDSGNQLSERVYDSKSQKPGSAGAGKFVLISVRYYLLSVRYYLMYIVLSASKVLNQEMNTMQIFLEKEKANFRLNQLKSWLT